MCLLFSSDTFNSQCPEADGGYSGCKIGAGGTLVGSMVDEGHGQETEYAVQKELG